MCNVIHGRFIIIIIVIIIFSTIYINALGDRFYSNMLLCNSLENLQTSSGLEKDW